MAHRFYSLDMQTTLTHFLAQSQQPDTIPLLDATNRCAQDRKRSREVSTVETYPGRSAACRSAALSTRLLEPRLYSRHHLRFPHEPKPIGDSTVPCATNAVVRELCPSIHPTRTNEDGESLVSSVDVFKNCVTDTLWDPQDEFVIATRRSGFQLFGVSALVREATSSSTTAPPLVDLKTTAVQSRLSAENRISFGLSTTQFLGRTLNVICGYSGASQVDVFDLEDLDEENGAPLCSFDLSSLLTVEQSQPAHMSVSATAISSLSDTLAVAALSNGCSAFLDTRTKKPVVCTRLQKYAGIVSACNEFARHDRQRRCNSAIEVLDRCCDARILTGSKEGVVELWDLRYGGAPVAQTAVGGAVVALQTSRADSSSRRGVPTVWLNTDGGDIAQLAIGATSFDTIRQVKTADNGRSHSGASISPPKLKLGRMCDCLIYPHISSNCVLVYEARDSMCDKKWTMNGYYPENENCCADRKQLTQHTRGDFKTAKTLLGDRQEPMQPDLDMSVKSANNQSVRLLQSLPCRQWMYQICSVSMANHSSSTAVGGDDGDISIILDTNS